MMLKDAPVNLSNFDHLVITPRPDATDVVFDGPGECRMQGVAMPTDASSPVRYGLQDYKTFVYDAAVVPAWTSFLTYSNGTQQNDFVVIREIPLYDNEDNTEIIEDLNETTVNICLKDRTFYKDGTWYTLCVPFDVPSLEGTPLEGAELRTMSDTRLEDGVLTITFAEATSVEAGKPYLMKWDHAPKVKNPLFEGVTVQNVAPMAVTSGMVRFKGTFSPWPLFAGDMSKLYLGDENRLYYAETDMQVNACRAFFEMEKSLANDPNQIRRIVLSFDGGAITGVDDLEVVSPCYNDDWYTIDGRRLTSKPTAPGIYINQGKKMLIK